MKPDFNNCLLNVTSTIMDHFNVQSDYQIMDDVKAKIKNAKHVFLVVLDGLGKNIIEKNLNEKSFIRKNVCKWITSVYPPTTVAATTSLLSALSPGETGWIGWHQYFSQVEEDVILFKNQTNYTGKTLSIDVANTYLPYIPFYTRFKNVKSRELYPKFRVGGFSSFAKMGKEMIKISSQNNQTYTYCYWDNPDYLIHELGTSHPRVKHLIRKLDKNLEKIYDKINPESAIIVVADHGLIDTKNLYLVDYPDLLECLAKKPTLEARTVGFKIRNKDKFEKLFQQYFGKWFKLYKREEFINEGYLGLNYQKAVPYLGDYIALATDKYCLCYQKEDMEFKASHAGDTDEEMIVPLIVLVK